eukprot:5024781-Prymnesium_polylepis.1
MGGRPPGHRHQVCAVDRDDLAASQHTHVAPVDFTVSKRWPTMSDRLALEVTQRAARVRELEYGPALHRVKEGEPFACTAIKVLAVQKPCGRKVAVRLGKATVEAADSIRKCTLLFAANHVGSNLQRRPQNVVALVDTVGWRPVNRLIGKRERAVERWGVLLPERLQQPWLQRGPVLDVWAELVVRELHKQRAG